MRDEGLSPAARLLPLHVILSTGAVSGRPWRDHDWSEVLRRDPCAYCGALPGSLKLNDQPVPWTIDHVVPPGAGGSRSICANGVGACRWCNNGKGLAPLLLFLAARLGLRLRDGSRLTRKTADAHAHARRRAELEAPLTHRLVIPSAP